MAIDTPSEVYQLGFRLAAQAGHEGLFALDVQDRLYDPWQMVRDRAREHDQEHLLDLMKNEWGERSARLYHREDDLKFRHTLREHLVYMNSEERILVGHGHYLVGLFGIGRGDDYAGADHVTGWWYNRNLRIFANIQRVTRSVSERILVIIGAGHLPILRHCAQASPEYQLVEVAEYLG